MPQHVLPYITACYVTMGDSFILGPNKGEITCALVLFFYDNMHNGVFCRCVGSPFKMTPTQKPHRIIGGYMCCGNKLPGT